MQEILLTSSVLILTVAALRRALRGRMDPRLQYALWLLVALRLLIPGSLFPSPVSVAGAAEEVRAAWEEKLPASPVSEGPAPASPFDTTGPILTLPAEGVTGQPVPPDLTVTHTPIAGPSDTTTQQIDWLPLIWKGGMVLTAAVLLGSNLYFYHTLRKKRRRLEPHALPVPCRAPVYLVEDLPSPCLFGLPRPGIYVNSAALEPGRLEHILIHEETHRRHGDHLWALLRSLCLALYWFDPLVWWAAALCRRDCEMACDHSALRRLGEDARIPYGQTLLGMLAPGRPLTGLLQTATTMTAGKRTMKERLELIAKRPRMLAVTLIAVLLVVAAVVAVTFGGEQPEEAQTDEPPAVSDLSEDQPVEPGLPTPEGRIVGTYTFLLVGADPVSGVAETIILSRYNMTNNTLRCMSIPRDTLVSAFPKPTKLNRYYFAGVDSGNLREQVRALTGILPDYTVTLQAQGVEALVDALGGVSFYVQQDMDYEDPAQNLSIHLEKGRQTLSGQEAMGLLRYRHYPNGDLDRIQVQKNFLRVLAAQCLEIDNVSTLLSAVKAASEHFTITSNAADLPGLTLENLLWLVQNVRDAENADVQFFTMPCTPGSYENQYYVFADPDGVLEMVNEHMNPYQRPILEEELRIVYQTPDGYLEATDGSLPVDHYKRASIIVDKLQRGDPVEEWLLWMDGLDWRALDFFSAPPDFDAVGALLETVSRYISEKPEPPEDLEYYHILSATEGLDDTAAAGYRGLVWQLYERNPRYFAQMVTGGSLNTDGRKFVTDCLARELAVREGVTYDSALVEATAAHLETIARADPDATISLGIATVDLAANAQAILDAIQAGEPTEDWLPLLNYMDWGTIGAVGRKAGLVDPCTMVQEAIYTYGAEKNWELTLAEYTYLLSATEGLDGAYAEGFSGYTWRLYENDPALFAHVVLSELAPAQRDQVLDFFRWELAYHPDGVFGEPISREEAADYLAEEAKALVTTDINGVRFTQVGQTAVFLPRNVYGVYSATYTSSDPAVASVDTPGVITCAAPGEATVTLHLECQWGQYDFTCAVTFQEGGGEAAYSVTPIWEEQTAKYQ